MNISSLNIDFEEFSEERKLYAADSLNNLNKLKLCTKDSQDVLQAQGEKNMHVPDLVPWASIKYELFFLILLIITVLATLILSSCVIFLLVQARYTTEEITQKLDTGEKDTVELAKIYNFLLFISLNQTKV
ncbi:leucine-rich single-pass membrane protein 1 [Ascaphus truei]|uniref:leucine-rich single-pass membrane protein 1 n=1 Tax=Ascaphus truei TaxID=8439 RepID=UPI003F59C077